MLVVRPVIGCGQGAVDPVAGGLGHALDPSGRARSSLAVTALPSAAYAVANFSASKTSLP